MVTTQEILERSIYSSLLKTMVDNGYSLKPEDYLPSTPATKVAYDADVKAIEATGKPYIFLFGPGNTQSRGIKECPRICIEPQGFFPGDIGFHKQDLEKTDDGYKVSESNYTETVDQLVNIHLVSNNISDMRVLHNILSSSIPQRGYIKPYIYPDKPFDGNIFIQLSNFFSLQDTDKGIMEKVYQFTIKDTTLDELFVAVDTISPIRDISVLLDDKELIKLE